MNFLSHFFAAACTTPTSGNAIIGTGCLPQGQASSTTLNKALLITFGIIGGLAVLFLVIGGFRYIASGGNAENVQKAKNQIIYSLIGLVIAALAATIVNFVVGKL